MTLVFVAKGMNVANPVGTVHVNPLPQGLPAGLVRAHLMRSSLGVVQINLVDGAPSAIEMSISSPADSNNLAYHDTYVHMTHGRAGWADPSYQVDYLTGYTWLVVGTADDTMNAYYTSTMNSQSTVGEEISYREGRIEFLGSRSTGEGSSFTRSRVTLPSVPEGFVMGFAVLDRVSAELGVYVPHLNELDRREAPPDSDPPSPQPGLYIGRASELWGTTGVETDAQMAFFAAWDRPLGQAEMQDAYTALKPWLAARGVNIA